MAHDINSGSIAQIDTFHSKIHNGVCFTYSEQTSVTGSGTRKIFIKVASTESLHFRASIVSVGAGTIGLYEAPTTSGDGNAQTWQNNNRTITKALTSTIFDTPTVSVNGTLLEAAGRAGTTAPTILGGQVNGNGEWVLKPSTNYYLLFTDTSAATNVTTINIMVYLGGANT